VQKSLVAITTAVDGDDHVEDVDGKVVQLVISQMSSEEV
jgi:hypothetical protein